MFRLRRRPDWTLFVALLVAQLVVLACTPVLTGHDLPQHLAYARLLSDWDAGHLAPVFEPPFGDDHTSSRIASSWRSPR